MPELPRMLPQAPLQPGAQTPTVGMRNDTGAGHALSGIDTVTALLSQLGKQEATTAGLNQASDDHVEYLARLSDLANAKQKPEDFQRQAQELAKEYLTGRDKVLQEKFGGSPVAMQVYKQHFNPKVEAGFSEAIKTATARRIAEAGPSFDATAGKMVRDLLAQGPDSPGWDDGLKTLNDYADSQNPALIPNIAALKQKHIDELFMGVAINQARHDALGTLKHLAGDDSYVVSLGKGAQRDILKMDPGMKETLTKIAYDELSKEAARATADAAREEREYSVERKRMEFNTTVKVLNGDPAAMSFLDRGGLDERGRPSMDASDVRAIYNLKQAFDNNKYDGPGDPIRFAQALGKIRRGELSDLEIAAYPGLNKAERSDLWARKKENDNKLQERGYAAYHSQVKHGENFIRAQLKATNPIAGFSAPDTTAETLVARYHAILEEKEAIVRALPGADPTSIAPMDVAAEFIKSQQENLAKQYEHDVEPMVALMKEFLPASAPISYSGLFKSIDMSNMTKTEKLIMRSVAYQMEQQGVTTDQITVLLRGKVTGETQPKADSGFTEWLNRMLRGARENWDRSQSWFKGENVGE